MLATARRIAADSAKCTTRRSSGRSTVPHRRGDGFCDRGLRTGHVGLQERVHVLLPFECWERGPESNYAHPVAGRGPEAATDGRAGARTAGRTRRHPAVPAAHLAAGRRRGLGGAPGRRGRGVLQSGLPPPPSPAPGAEPPPDQQHSMDPCGQLNAAALRGFGEPKLESDYGDFDHCDVTIRRDQNGIANVQAQLLDKSPEVTSGWLSKKIGAPTVLSGPKTEDSCERIIVLDRPAATQPAAVWCSTGTRRSRCGRANSWRSTAARRCAGSSTGAACAGSGSSTAPTPVPRDCGRPSRC